MKFRVIFAVFTCLVVYACTLKIPNNYANESSDKYFEEIMKFNFEGHDYIRFTKDVHDHRATGGVVHDPECKKCFQQFD